MGAAHRILTYFVVPFLVFPVAALLLHHLLSLPILWLLLPAVVVAATRPNLTIKPTKLREVGVGVGRPGLATAGVLQAGRYSTVVVGAGFSGLCTGAGLRARGIPFTIFEAAEDVGGTWHHNTYPGAACDVWTSLYQFSFFQNPTWSRCKSHQHLTQYH